LIFTALHEMQARSSDENSVCPSVRPSVCPSVRLSVCLSVTRVVRDHACDRQTDGQTDERTEFSSLDRVCISCSAVKTLWQYDRLDAVTQFRLLGCFF